MEVSEFRAKKGLLHGQARTGSSGSKDPNSPMTFRGAFCFYRGAFLKVPFGDAGSMIPDFLFFGWLRSNSVVFQES